MGITICVIGVTIFFVVFFSVIAFAFARNASDFSSTIGYFAFYWGLPDLLYIILSLCLIFTLFKFRSNFAKIKKENNTNDYDYDYNMVAGNNVELQTYSPDNNHCQV